MYGIDISYYQKDINLANDKYQFAIIKATEGTCFVSPTLHDFAVQLTKLNKLIGCYHYARPDTGSTIEKMEREAIFFVDTLEKEGLLYNSILVLDWEEEPMDREDLITAWLNKVMDSTGIIPFIYGSKSKFSKWKDYEILRKFPIWCAYWPYQSPMDVGTMRKDIKIETSILEGVQWSIWQYTNIGRYPGLSTNVDLNYSTLTPNEWKEYYCDQRYKNMSSVQWAIKEGLIVGDGKGDYFLDKTLTREQACILMKKFHDKYIK